MATMIRYAPTDTTCETTTRYEPAGCLRTICSEYREMPGLALTRRQAVKLWSLAPELMDRLLSELVAVGFLRRNATGRYVRADFSHN